MEVEPRKGDISFVAAYFFSAWGGLGLKGNPLPVFEDIGMRYGERHRHYHTLTHIQRGLHELMDVQPRLPEALFSQLVFAFVMHDYVYWVDQERYPLNKQASAQAAATILHRHGGTKWAEPVAGAIMATAHMQSASDPLTVALLDLDLSGLGATYSRFFQDRLNIRQELQHIPVDRFYMKQAALLTSLLNRQYIYATPHFRQQYEVAARANLEQYLNLQIFEAYR